MTVKHTPGPWKARPWTTEDGRTVEFEFIIDAPNGQHLAMVWAQDNIHDKEILGSGEANARLIAAAPEMLEALEAISPMLPRSLSTATWGDPAWTDALGKVEVAIAKAKGEP